MSERRSDPFSEAEVAALRDILAQLNSQEEMIGNWSTKCDARQTGFSLHAKFEKKVDIMDTLAVVAVMEQAPIRLYQIVDRVLGQIEAAEAAS